MDYPLLYLLGAFVSLAVGLAVGGLCLLVGWRHYQRQVLGRDVGPMVPPMIMIGPGVLTLLALLLSYGLFRQWLGVPAPEAAPSAPGSGCEPGDVLGALGITAFCAWAGWRGLRHYRQAARRPLSAIAGLPDGVARIAGKAHAPGNDQPVHTPVTGIDCLLVQSTLIRVGDERSETLYSHASDAAFLLRDDTAQVTVNPQGAEVLLEASLQWTPAAGLTGTPRALAALRSQGIDESNAETWLTERLSTLLRGETQVPPPAAAANDAHRQALEYLAGMQAALSQVDLRLCYYTERLLFDGDPVEIVGTFQRASNTIGEAPGMLFAIAGDAPAIDGRYRGRLKPVAWAGAAIAGLLWLNAVAQDCW